MDYSETGAFFDEYYEFASAGQHCSVVFRDLPSTLKNCLVSVYKPAQWAYNKTPKAVNYVHKPFKFRNPGEVNHV
jgi:hypothetical protein